MRILGGLRTRTTNATIDATITNDTTARAIMPNFILLTNQSGGMSQFVPPMPDAPPPPPTGTPSTLHRALTGAPNDGVVAQVIVMLGIAVAGGIVRVGAPAAGATTAPFAGHLRASQMPKSVDVATMGTVGGGGRGRTDEDNVMIVYVLLQCSKVSLSGLIKKIIKRIIF